MKSPETQARSSVSTVPEAGWRRAGLRSDGAGAGVAAPPSAVVGSGLSRCEAGVTDEERLSGVGQQLAPRLPSLL